MHSPIAHSLDALAAWRTALDGHVGALARALAEPDLLDDADAAALAALRERLASDKLVLAFVAEFSRGKSELVNAIFFGDAGCRVLPATPGRTTMCPVELRFDATAEPRLSLLPIETRLGGQSLAELRSREEPWQHLPLDPGRPQTLVQALAAVTQTRRVSVQEATALGLWSDDQPEDNPPPLPDGTVEVPTWRHAIINYPHPLLQRGLVVIDTPGLNAIGAEPELTLGLLPAAHAVVFVLAADTGVTRSDLALWRDHLGPASLERFVVLNKIDTLADPLASAAEVQAQVERQRQHAAATLEVPLQRVFALSAREALASRRLSERRRRHAEQLLELRGLRGKSSTKTRLLAERVEAEAADFERCTGRLTALRAVQLRLQHTALAALSAEALRTELAAMKSAMTSRPFNLGGRAAFEALVGRLHQSLAGADTQADEMRQMLQAAFEQLNTEFGYALQLSPVPPLQPFRDELDLIARNYGRYLGLGQAWRMAAPGFAEQFRRMLLSKLRVVFESAAGELEQWCKAASSQVEVQLRERRRAYARRRETLQRVQAAAGELETRIAEVQAQEEHLRETQVRIEALADAALTAARRPGAEPGAPKLELHLQQVAA